MVNICSSWVEGSDFIFVDKLNMIYQLFRESICFHAVFLYWLNHLFMSWPWGFSKQLAKQRWENGQFIRKSLLFWEFRQLDMHFKWLH